MPIDDTIEILIMPTPAEEEQAVCAHCDADFPVATAIYIDELGNVCPACYARSVVCIGCGDTMLEDDQGWEVCPVCTGDYFCCESCERIYNMDEYGGNGLCTRCYHEDDEEDNENSDFILSYHQDVTLHFQALEGEKTKLYLGVELETDYYPDRERAAGKLTKLGDYQRLFWLTEDSSLNNGIEIISQPATLAFHKEKMPWQEICTTVTAHGGKSNDTNTCGLHIHLSKAYFTKRPALAQLKLVYIGDKFWTELTTLARRTSGFATKWDKAITDRTSQRKVAEIRSEGMGHYAGINLLPRHTVEVRLFKGTLNYTTLMATIELVHYLAYLANTKTLRYLKEATWVKLFEGIDKRYTFLPDYLRKHNLHPDQDPQDNGYVEPTRSLAKKKKVRICDVSSSFYNQIGEVCDVEVDSVCVVINTAHRIFTLNQVRFIGR